MVVLKYDYKKLICRIDHQLSMNLNMPVKVQIEFHYHTKIQGSKNDKRKESDTFKDDSPMMKKYCVT